MGIMNKKIAVVGSGLSAALMARLALEHPDVEIIDGPQEYCQQSEPIPYKITPAHIQLPSFGEKRFTCKGKHQYREVIAECGGESSWICQCGRNMKD